MFNRIGNPSTPPPPLAETSFKAERRNEALGSATEVVTKTLKWHAEMTMQKREEKLGKEQLFLARKDAASKRNVQRGNVELEKGKTHLQDLVTLQKIQFDAQRANNKANEETNTNDSEWFTG